MQVYSGVFALDPDPLINDSSWQAGQKQPFKFATLDSPFAPPLAVVKQENSWNNVYEIPIMRRMLPDPTSASVLDVGCGCGDLCEYLIERGAASVFGVDISQNMIAEANKRFASNQHVNFECCAFEDVSLPGNTYELVVSSLALHYLSDFNAVCAAISDSMKPNGHFVFSVEHPVLTANKTDWLLDINGNWKYNAIMDYFTEGIRQAPWLEADVTCYHNQFSTLINSLVNNGLAIKEMQEAGFLFVKAQKV